MGQAEDKYAWMLRVYRTEALVVLLYQDLDRFSSFLVVICLNGS